MRDPRLTFRQYLLSLTGLTALVGTRIYCDPLPNKAALPAVTYFTQSTLEEEGFPIQEVTATVHCFGKNEQEARGVFGALVTALQAEGADEVTIGGEVLSGIDMEGSETTDQAADVDDFWFTKCQITFAMDV